MRRFPAVKNLVLCKTTGPKRFAAEFTMGGKHRIVRFGDPNGSTYADGASSQKRNSYRARASKITNARGQYTYKIPGTANSLAYWLLW
jgi:hypothetical protein